MKSIAIFRHAATEGPGFLGDFFDKNGLPWQLTRIDAGDALPASAEDYSGLVFMGGPMSVNDDLPWIPPVLKLIQEAVAADIPVLGHCLGGQLMSKAMGGVVGSNKVREIGWGEITVAANEQARHWFGETKNFSGFHWHGETFSLPQGATRLLSSAYCENQAFAIGKHLGFQCHVEMTANMVQEWCHVGAAEIAPPITSPAVQPAEEIERDLASRIEKLNAVAEGVYTQWIKGLSR
ncbi:MAG TPA: type 1 glutamine amidotransferase [Methylophilaceae bacterium]